MIYTMNGVFYFTVHTKTRNASSSGLRLDKAIPCSLNSLFSVSSLCRKLLNQFSAAVSL